MRLFRLLPLILALCWPYIAAAKDGVSLTRVDFSQLPGWYEGNSDTLKSEALKAFAASCEKILTLPEDRELGPNAGQVSEWKPACYKARGTLKRIKESRLPAEQDEMSRRFFEGAFMPYRVTTSEKEEGLFTGYYVPELKASRTQRGKYKYPVYAVPRDLKKDAPYKTRAQINAGALKGRKLEIAYVEDPVKLFFLHVQGTGRLSFDDGSSTYIGFASRNYRPYTALGKVLVDMGKLPPDGVSAPIIMEWLYKHPEQAQRVMEQNESFIFFREVKGGANGAQGVTLTPLASLAVDKQHMAMGVPLWLDASLPVKDRKSAKTFRSLFIAQDTGAAIKGPIRGDVFFGSGTKAEWQAGHMKQYGQYYLFLPLQRQLAREEH